jgi:hypothetical protein
LRLRKKKLNDEEKVGKKSEKVEERKNKKSDQPMRGQRAS